LKLVAPRGSPPPTTTSSTTAQPTTFAMTVTITGSFTFSVVVPPTLPVVFTYHGVVEVDGHGTGTFALTAESTDDGDPPTGDIVIDFGGSTLSGQFIASGFVNVSKQQVAIAITEGTGDFTGAHGGAMGTLDVGPIRFEGVDLNGTMTGTLEIPS